MFFPAFLVQQYLPAGAFGSKILGLHAQRRGDAGKRVGEDGDQCAVAQITNGFGRNAVEELVNPVREFRDAYARARCRRSTLSMR